MVTIFTLIASWLLINIVFVLILSSRMERSTITTIFECSMMFLALALIAYLFGVWRLV